MALRVSHFDKDPLTVGELKFRTKLGATSKVFEGEKRRVWVGEEKLKETLMVKEDLVLEKWRWEIMVDPGLESGSWWGKVKVEVLKRLLAIEDDDIIWSILIDFILGWLPAHKIR